MRRIIIACGVLVAGTAAGDTPATWVGVDLEVLPQGTLQQTTAVGTNGVTTAAASTAYALGGSVEHRVGDWLSIGFAPRLLWNIGPADAVSSASSSPATGDELDLRMRIAADTRVGRWRLFAFLAPGYAFGFEPMGSTTQHPDGAIAGVGAGFNYARSSTFVWTGELGYQWGFQRYTDPTRGDIRDRTAYAHVAFGCAWGVSSSPAQSTPALTAAQ
jgi:hypothetical protein